MTILEVKMCCLPERGEGKRIAWLALDVDGVDDGVVTTHPFTAQEITMARSLLPFSRNVPMSRWNEDMDPLVAVRREMNRLFEDAFRDVGFPSGFASGLRQIQPPKIDVSETDKELKICAELPGVSEDDVEVLLDDDRLIIRGEINQEREDGNNDRNYHVRERMQGAFSRVLPLHFRADPDKVQASFRHGVLTIKMPKPEEEQQRQRRIKIQKETGSAANTSERAGGIATSRDGTSGAAGSPAGRAGSTASSSTTSQPVAEKKEKETTGS